MRVLAQNKLLPVRVLCSNWTPILHLVDSSAQSSPWARGPLAGCCTTATTAHRIKAWDTFYVQLYLEGSSQPQQNRRSLRSQGHCLPAPCLPKTKSIRFPLVPSPLLGLCNPRTIQKTVKLSPGLQVLFFFLVGLLWQRTIDWTQKKKRVSK